MNGYYTAQEFDALVSDEAALRALVASGRVDIDARDQNGYSLLTVAILQEATAVARWLIEQGANVHVMCRVGSTALSCACSKGNFVIASMLLQRGASVHHTIFGRSMMTSALGGDHLELARLLADHGASVPEMGYDMLRQVHAFVRGRAKCYAAARALMALRGSRAVRGNGRDTLALIARLVLETRGAEEWEM